MLKKVQKAKIKDIFNTKERIISSDQTDYFKRKNQEKLKRREKKSYRQTYKSIRSWNLWNFSGYTKIQSRRNWKEKKETWVIQILVLSSEIKLKKTEEEEDWRRRRGRSREIRQWEVFVYICASLVRYSSLFLSLSPQNQRSSELHSLSLSDSRFKFSLKCKLSSSRVFRKKQITFLDIFNFALKI